ncbi:MAG: SgcJ/EcaC family oxidoreductase [Ktedonobacterales bacterium]
MNSQLDVGSETSLASDDARIRSLYQQLLESWNQRDVGAYVALFETEANVIGFDGSLMNGRAEIESTIRQIFTDHVTAAYIGKARGVRFLTPEVAVLRAIVGMIPPGKTDINPAVNAMQTLVAVKQDGQWRIALFQNTPAQFHGRPEATEALTSELRQLL